MVTPNIAISMSEAMPLALDGDQPLLNGVSGINQLPQSQVNGDTGVHVSGTNKTSKYDIPLNENLAYTPRKIRVITIGAGFSGLMMAHKFQHRFPEMDSIAEHAIVESRGELGGTWLVNTYPGVQCDVPSHVYVTALVVLLSSNHLTTFTH